jgi:hypothetical protein
MLYFSYPLGLPFLYPPIPFPIRIVRYFMIRRFLPWVIFLLPALACSIGSPASHADQLATEVARQLTAATALPMKSTLFGENQIATEVAQQLTASGKTISPLGAATTAVQVTPSATPTPSQTMTATTTPSFTPPADDPAKTLGSPTWRDTFENGNSWYLDDDGSIRMEVKDHVLSLFGTASKFYDTWRFAPANLSPNYYLQMSAAMDACSGRDRFGLLFGGTGNGALQQVFLFGITCDGKYSFRYYDSETKKYSMHINWTPSGYINTGAHQGNRLGVKVEGLHTALYINGHYVGDFTVPSFGNGRYGIFAASENTANLHVAVTEFAYWKIP